MSTTGHLGSPSPVCASRYARLRRDLDRQDPGDRLQTRSPAFSELQLQSLWFAGEFGNRFTTAAGAPLEIIQFGHWNHSAGPDFIDTAVRLGDELLRGAIELDPEARDWERHGHAENRDYENVILHVFFDAGPGRFFTRTPAHREVTQLRIDLADHPNLDPSPDRPADAHLGRCAYVFKELSDDLIEEILLAATRFRLEQKARRLHRTEKVHGKDQALFQGMAEALGYRRNAFPLRVLSQQAPIGELTKLSAPMEIDALLFGLAGFLEAPHHVESDREETTRYQRDLWSAWWRQREGWRRADPTHLPWKTVGVRPQNHPQRRLAALSQLVAAWKPFARIVLEDDLNPRAIESFLTQLSHPYWDRHYTLKAPARKPLALIGPSRARDILINQILPLRNHRESEASWECYRRLGASQSNEKLRRAALRLFGDDPRHQRFQRKAYHQQALLQIYDDFCLRDASGCEDCPFPEQLWRMTAEVSASRDTGDAGDAS